MAAIILMCWKNILIEMSNIEDLPILEKPPYLYHGSSSADLEELTPQQRSYRDVNEGPCVFATPDLAMATVFMSREGKHSGFFEDVPWVVIVKDRDEFIKEDKGGVVYVLPTEEFKCDSRKGLGIFEWTCDVGVKPKEIIKYPSSLGAMLESGVQVFFVDSVTEEKIKKSDDHGLSILQNLQSENQRRGINVRKLTEE